ncbi:nucleoside phosphorylase [Dialister sp.]|uniref:nucleoside phosphorylase n=1 Tax=Dialister sp. TaxID=1955814 RepID=UPI002E807DC2|nr:nucleoside phosphorylase [Dialister sp.]MEE3453323.1 nucleoside phosphorylase [Dialister sp.]
MNDSSLSPIPLSEFTPTPGLISPRFEKLDLHLPKRCLLAFLGEKRIEAFAKSKGGEVIGKFLSLTKPFPLYRIPGEKEDILLVQAPAGAPSAVLIEDRLFAYGVGKILAIGCCGALSDIPENCFFPIEKALRDEGTSFHYLPPSRFVDLPKGPLEKLKAFYEEKGYPFHPATTWTSDGFFRETREKIEMRKKEGCTLVDMECSALAACAIFRQKDFAQIMFTADTLAKMAHDQRNWGAESRNAALLLGMEAVMAI